MTLMRDVTWSSSASVGHKARRGSVDAVVAGFWGAIIGAALTGLVTFLVALWGERQAKVRAKATARLALVREVMRYRGEQESLVQPLNEVPLLFGDDAEVMRHLRELRSASGNVKNEALRDLVNRLAHLTDLDPKVTASDINTPFTFKPS